MFIVPNCVKNGRVQALSDSVKFSGRLLQKILDLLSCDFTTSTKKEKKELPSRVCMILMIERKSLMRDRQIIVTKELTEICAHWT